MHILLVASSERILEELDDSDASKTDLIKSPHCIGVVLYIPNIFGFVGILKDESKSPAVV